MPNASLRIGLGSENADRSAAKFEFISGFARHDRDVQVSRLLQQAVQVIARQVCSHPQFFRTEIRQDRSHASHVIGVGMSDDDRVEASTPRR